MHGHTYIKEEINYRFKKKHVISGFRREVDEKRALPGYYTVRGGNS